MFMRKHVIEGLERSGNIEGFLEGRRLTPERVLVAATAMFYPVFKGVERRQGNANEQNS